MFSNTHWVARVVYALGASTFTLCSGIGQGESYAALTAPAIRVFGDRNIAEIAAMGQAIGLAGLRPAPEAIVRVAAAIETLFRDLGLKTRLRDYGVPRDLLPRILAFSMRNYNADRERQFLHETDALEEALDQAW